MLDSLKVFAISLAALVAAVLFLVAVLHDVSLSTAATRAFVGWLVLSGLGVGIASLIRWILLGPPRPGSRLDLEA